MVYYTGKPIEKGIRTTSHKQNRIDLQTTILERLKNRTSYLPSPSKYSKRWFPHFITAIALEVIKYKAGKQFTFHDDAKSQRKTTTV